MIQLGIIGAENSHSSGVARVCNIDKKVAMRVTHLWGETRASAAVCAAKGAIPQVVQDWRKMLSKVDGVMIDHRDGGLHAEVATFFLRNGVPTFVDKPLTTSLREARALFRLAEKKNTPLCTFGLVPLQETFRNLMERLTGKGVVQAFNTSGPADMDGPHGGIFFYGFHQVEAIVEVMGTEAERVSLHRNGRDAVATISFSRGRMATMHCLAGEVPFHWSACTDRQIFSVSHRHDHNIYLSGVQAIYLFLARGKRLASRARMLAPIAILEALQKSLKHGTAQLVARV